MFKLQYSTTVTVLVIFFVENGFSFYIYIIIIIFAAKHLWLVLPSKELCALGSKLAFMAI